MADITLTPRQGAELAVQSGDLYLPCRGTWTAHLVLAEAPDTPPAGQVILDYHGLRCSGTVLRAGLAEGRCTVLVVGGAGGLSKELEPKYYDHQIPVSLPLQELLQAAGEQLAATAGTEALRTTLPSWPRRRDQAGHLLDALAEAAGAFWRVLPDGSIYFGGGTLLPPTDFVEDRDWQLLHTAPEWLYQEIAPLRCGVQPGHRFGLGLVGRVHYEDDGACFTARIWYLGEDGTDDGVVAGLRAIIREELQATVSHPHFGGQVVTQRGDGSLDLQMDDRRLPPLTSVPYLVPVPGSKLRVLPGSRVQVAFTGGDPRRPTAQLYEGGSGTKPAARQDDPVGYLYVTTGPLGLMGATVVVNVSWSYARLPVLPPNTVEYPLTISGGSPDLSLP